MDTDQRYRAGQVSQHLCKMVSFLVIGWNGDGVTSINLHKAICYIKLVVLYCQLLSMVILNEI